MGQLPANVRAGCSTTDNTSAICRLTDGTVVFYRLFDTATEAHADVVNGNEQAPNGTPCPPSECASRRRGDDLATRNMTSAPRARAEGRTSLGRPVGQTGDQSPRNRGALRSLPG
jgi:hypothetical protein